MDENRSFVEYKPHPFYLLLIGEESEVNAFAQALQEKFDAEIADNEFYTCEVQLMKTGDWGEASDYSDITGFATDGVLTGQTQQDETRLASGQVADPALHHPPPGGHGPRPDARARRGPAEPVL